MLHQLSEKVEKYKILIVLVGISLGILSGAYTIKHCKINTDTEDLLSDELDWRVDYNRFKSAFSELTDTLVIIIESPIPEAAQAVAEKLKSDIQANPEYFSFASYPQNTDFFLKNSLLYLEEYELESLIDKISESQAFLGLLAEKPNFETFLDIIAMSLEREKRSEKFLESADNILRNQFVGYSQPLSWQQLVSGDEKNSTRILLLAKPKLNFQEILPAEQAISFLKKRIKGLEEIRNGLVSISITGSAALNNDELLSVTEGSKAIGFAALICVTFILYVGLKSGSLILASLISLLTGLACTAGFATLAIGTLNMISIAFAVLYVGLAIDFAIHLCLRYQESCVGYPKNKAIKRTVIELGRSISLCALTTSIGFLSFIPTDYRGVAELGLISGVGMLLSLIISLTLLPAILHFLPMPANPIRKSNPFLKALDSGRHDNKVFFLSIIICVLSIGLVKYIHFDHDPINLNNQAAPSVIALKRLADNQESPMSNLSIITETQDNVIKITERLDQEPAVKKTVSMLDLVPKGQIKKLDLIEQLNFIMGGAIEVNETKTPSPTAISKKIESIISKFDITDTALSENSVAVKLKTSLLELQTKLNLSNEKEAHKIIRQLEENTFLYFPHLIRTLSEALAAETFTFDSVPEEMKNLWYKEGLYRVEVQPTGDSDSKSSTKMFVDSVKKIAGDGVTGPPIINIEAGNSVIFAFVQALLTALCLIFLIIWITCRKVSAAILIMTPIILSCLMAGGFLVLFKISINFANIIALPLLLGIGIDSSIHIFHRHSQSIGGFLFLQSSTSRGVIFSSLTTAASFGSLAVSPHAGTASLGVLLALSLGCIIICSLGLLPALIRRFN